MATIRVLAPGEVPVALLSDVLPSPLSGTPYAGVSSYAARADHNHDDTDLRNFVNGQVPAVNAARDDALADILTDKNAAQAAIAADRLAAVNEIADDRLAAENQIESDRVGALADIEAARTEAVATISAKTRNFMFEVDFGAVGHRSFSGTISGITDLAVGQAVVVSQSGMPATGRSADENEMDAFICRGLCETAGTIRVFINSLFGPVSGAYRFIATF